MDIPDPPLVEDQCGDVDQVSDSLRLLAPALHEGLDRLLTHFVVDDGKTDKAMRTRDAEMAELDALLLPATEVLALAGARAAAQLLRALRQLLTQCARQSQASALQLSAAQADAAVDALWRLHDYLDALHDKGSDSDMCDWLLFAPWQRLCHLAMAAPMPPSGPSQAEDSAPDFAQALARLRDADSFDAMAWALRVMAAILASRLTTAPWCSAAHGFVQRLCEGRQTLDVQALELLAEVAGRLVAEDAPAAQEATSAVAIATDDAGHHPDYLEARITLLVVLADERMGYWRRTTNESQLMVRLLLQADEMQAAWERYVSQAETPARMPLAWQWGDSLLRAAATARRLWPRLRGPGLSGFLHALAGLGLPLAQAPQQERRDREVSSCLILVEEALRRRFYLEDDSQCQSDCILAHLADVARGGSGAEDFPWFSRELRGDLARRMEGVVEGELLRKLAEVESCLQSLWRYDGRPEVHDPIEQQAWQNRIHDELSQIAAQSRLLAPEAAAMGQALQQLVSTCLAQTLHADAAECNTLRATMVRDIARFGQLLGQMQRSPPNRHRRAANGVVMTAEQARDIRRVLDQQDDTVGTFSLPSGPPSVPDATMDFSADAPGAMQPEQPDAEMMEVFQAEAQQLLDDLRVLLPLLASDAADLDQLQSARRCFHTFKGSARMVGLQAFSEAAQAIEMLLNARLAAARAGGQARLATAVSALLDGAVALLANWIAELVAAGQSARQAPSLVAQALRLRADSVGPALEDEADLAPAATAASEPVAGAQPQAVSMPAPRHEMHEAHEAASGDPQLRSIYLNEARQLFKAMRQHGSSWRAKADSGLIAGAPPMFARAVHTLRGCSAAAGFTGMQQMAGALEDLFDHLKAGGGLDGSQLALVEAAVASMQSMQQAFSEGANPMADAAVLARLSTLQGGAGVIPAPVVEVVTDAAPVVPLEDQIDLELLPLFLEEGHDLLAAVGEGLHRFQRNPGTPAVLVELLRALHTVKGSARMAGALRLGLCLHELESGIQGMLRQPARSGGIDVLLALYDRAHRQFELLEQLSVLPTSDGSAGQAMQPMSESERRLASPLVRIKVSTLDRLLNQVGEISIARSQLENEVEALKKSASELADNIAKLSGQLRDVEIQAEIQISASHQAHHDNTPFDPLELDRFTHLHELTRMMAESVNDVASLQRQLADSAGNTQNGLQRQGRTMRELQQELMHTRMVKFNSLEPRLQHLVWQLKRETGKALALEIDGGEVELDRGILEKMIGAFEHLLRNAAVHGIEQREERAACGKALMGRLQVQAVQEGSEAIIRISDDGAGLDLDAIRAKAWATGLLPEGQVAEEGRIIELIFEPGFSTSAQVSALAGRGVGMDVVRSEVAALGGRITVHTLRGVGARFTMHLPLSLAVKQVCLLRLGTQSYAIPSMLVEKVVQLRGEQMRQALSEGTLDQGEQRVALHTLSSLLDEPRAPDELPPASVYVLFIKSGNELVAIMVDQVRGNREVVAKPVGPQLSTLVGVVGATVLGNGEIALIINPLLLARRIGYRRRQNAQRDLPARARKIIMVVDDSLTVRKVMQRLLVREGYTVMVACDGYDAIGQLHDVTPDVFLVDIEMPRMDGFTLVRHLRDNEATRARPIVMITSRTGAKHRERAMEVGVNYYLGKPYQDEQLLALLQHYTRGQDPSDDFSDVLF